MNIDFHVHSKITSPFKFDALYLDKYSEECKLLGVDAIVLLEHCHAKYFEETFEYVEHNYEKTEDSYNINGLTVFTGIEVTTLEKFDVVVMAKREYVLKIKKDIDEFLVKEKYDYIPIEKLLDMLNSNEAIIILAHPYRRFDVFPNVNFEIFEKLDAVEINATDLYKFGINENTKRIKELGKKLGKSIVAGSDSHHPLQVGSVWTSIDGSYTKVLDIKEKMKLGNLEIGIANNIEEKISKAREIKKSLCGKA